MILKQLDAMGVPFIELREVDRDVQSSFKWTKSKPILSLSEGYDPSVVSAENVTVRASCLAPDYGSSSVTVEGGEGEERLNTLKKNISALKRRGKNVFFDAQHFFDGFYSNSDYALTVVETAAQAGASRIVLCDSRGAALPDQIGTGVKMVSRYLGSHKVILGIHAHNDCGLAVANTLAAINFGARHVQASVNGLGERSGNADLCQLLPLLMIKLGYRVLNSSKPASKQLEGLKRLSEDTSRACGFSIPNQPFVSTRAFSHAEPSHLGAVLKNPRLYEPVDPAAVGNARTIGLGDIQMLVNEISDLGLYAKDPKGLAELVLRRMKDLEARGYKFADAKASVHLVILEVMGSEIVPFEITSWETSSVRTVSDNVSKVGAMVRATVGQGSRARTVSARSEGVGPIHAIDLAIKRVLCEEYPELRHVRLVSYSLNIVDSLSGSAASARARTEFADEGDSQSYSGPGTRTWATVSVSDDVIDASIRALVDGYRYKLIFFSKKEHFALPDWRTAIA